MSYFKVGEECILQSVHNPELNGDCVITVVEAPKIRWQKAEGSRISYGVNFAYFTTIPHPNGIIWAESALRKKHKPSTKSLSTMIEELNKVKV